LIDHPHAKLARTAWEAAAHGDRETLARLCSPELVWHASGRGPRSGDYRGLEAVLEYLAAIGEAAERFDSEFEDVLVGTDLVGVLFHVKGRRRGRALDTRFLLLFRVEEGRIAEVWAVPRDQYAVDEFWRA
jgi:ketosteroid isomerase-like protein